MTSFSRFDTPTHRLSFKGSHISLLEDACIMLNIIVVVAVVAVAFFERKFSSNVLFVTLSDTFYV